MSSGTEGAAFTKMSSGTEEAVPPTRRAARMAPMPDAATPPSSPSSPSSPFASSSTEASSLLSLSSSSSSSEAPAPKAGIVRGVLSKLRQATAVASVVCAVECLLLPPLLLLFSGGAALTSATATTAAASAAAHGSGCAASCATASLCGVTHAQLLGVAVPLATVSSVSAFAQHRRAPVLLWSLGGVALLGSGETFGHAVGVAGSLLVASGQWRSQYVISKINECCEDCYVHRASAAVRKRAQLLLKRRPSSSHASSFAAGAEPALDAGTQQ